jgi:FlaG/FlaF family flagellin (archaellin)
MTLSTLRQSDDAVSPVVGVILMLGITIILASVVAPTILSGQSDFDPPDAQFEWDYQPSNDRLRITHAGGDSVDVEHLYIRGSGFDGSGGGSNSFAGEGSLDRVVSDKMDTGEYVTTGVTSDYDLKIVYEDGQQSTVLSENVGPDA